MEDLEKILKVALSKFIGFPQNQRTIYDIKHCTNAIITDFANKYFIQVNHTYISIGIRVNIADPSALSIYPHNLFMGFLLMGRYVQEAVGKNKLIIGTTLYWLKDWTMHFKIKKQWESFD